MSDNREWLPIDSAPRDGTRVELWGLGHRGWKAFYAWHNGHRWLDDHDEPVMGLRLTHYRPEPDGPESKPDQAVTITNPSYRAWLAEHGHVPNQSKPDQETKGER